MKIVWDQPKHLANIAKYGLDFATLTEDFFAEALVISAKNGRYLAIGKDVNGVVSVVFATLGLEGISVISMRSASPKERRCLMPKTKVSRTKRGYTDADLKVVSNNPEWTKEDFARARPFSEVFPKLDASIKRSRGRPKVESPREAVTLRLSPDTIEKFKAAGDNWRTKMAKALERAKV
jgi:uncharacterized DUF497 family protein/uncharacterized protein (DUF4415 family)